MNQNPDSSEGGVVAKDAYSKSHITRKCDGGFDCVQVADDSNN
jgi:hypothetical protein